MHFTSHVWHRTHPCSAYRWYVTACAFAGEQEVSVLEVTGNKSGHESGPSKSDKSILWKWKGQVQPVTLPMLSSWRAVSGNICRKIGWCVVMFRCLWGFYWKLKICWLRPHLSKWGSRCYKRKEESNSSYTNDNCFCFQKKDAFFVKLLACVHLFFSNDTVSIS